MRFFVRLLNYGEDQALVTTRRVSRESESQRIGQVQGLPLDNNELLKGKTDALYTGQYKCHAKITKMHGTITLL